MGVSAEEVAQYTAERTTVLATLVGLPGYAQAVVAERDNIVAFAAIQAADEASLARERLISIIQGAIFMAARIIAVA